MNAPFGPKRPVQLDLTPALLDRSRGAGRHAAGSVEAALGQPHLAAEEACRADARARAADHARFTAAYAARHGRWGEEFDPA